jgi:hypothetical protein
MSRLNWLFQCLLAISLLHAFDCRSVSVSVKAPWKAHALSFVPQISEFVFDHTPENFWAYANNLCFSESFQTAVVSSAHTEDQIVDLHATAIDAASALLPSSMHSLMHTMVALGHYVPAVEFFEKLSSKYKVPGSCVAADGTFHEAFVVLFPGEHVLCKPEQLARALADINAAAPTDSAMLGSVRKSVAKEWDHVFSSPSSASASASGSGSLSPAVKAVLYGLLGSPSFCAMHAALSAAVAAGSVGEYSARHSLQLPAMVNASSFSSSSSSSSSSASAAPSTLLQGYGVFLDIKNMEYKNVDDAAASATSSSSSSTSAAAVTAAAQEAADWEVLGLNFTALFQHIPASVYEGGSDRDGHAEGENGGEKEEQQQRGGKGRGKAAMLEMLRESLQHQLELGNHGGGVGAGAAESGATMKVWKMHDLGLQTLQLVHTAAVQGTDTDAMKKLADIVHNFPRMASMISATKVSAPVRNEVQKWYQAQQAMMMMGGGGMMGGVGGGAGSVFSLPPNSLFANGRRVDLAGSTFNVFDLLVTLREEVQASRGLAELPFERDVKDQIARIAGRVGESGGGGGGGGAAPKQSARVDVSKGGKYVVNFLNNLEKDASYQHMPRTLRMLLQPSWQLVSLSRNLYTMIAVVDPLSLTGASMLMQMYMMMQQMYPVRFGVVFSCEEDGGPLRKSKFLHAEMLGACVNV